MINKSPKMGNKARFLLVNIICKTNTNTIKTLKELI